MGSSSTRLGLGPAFVWGLVLLAAVAGCQIIAGLNDPVPGVPKGDGGIDGTLDGPSPRDTGSKREAAKPTPETSTGDSAHDGGDGGLPDTGEPDAGGDAGVPIEFVQGASMEFGAADSGTLALGTTIAGDLVVLVLSYDLVGAPAPVVTDTLGDTYNVALGPIVNADSYTRYLEYAENIPSGALSISVALTTPPGHSFQVYASEYSGVIPSGALDATAWRTGTSAAVDGMMSGAKPTTVPHELIFGYGESGSVAPGTGFTARETLNANVAEDRVVRKLGSYETTATMTDGSGWEMFMATFKGY